MTRHRRHMADHGVPQLTGRALQHDVRRWSWLPLSLVVTLPLGANLAMLIVAVLHLRSVVWCWQDIQVAAMAVLSLVPLLAVVGVDLSIRGAKAGRRWKVKRLGIAVAPRFQPPAQQ